MYHQHWQPGVAHQPLGRGTGEHVGDLAATAGAHKAVEVTSALSDDRRTRIYTVRGQLFFVAVDKFIDSFDYRERIHHIEIDLTRASLWDSSAVAAIDKVVGKFRRNGMEVEVKAPGGESGELHDKLALHDKGADLGPGGH